MHALDDCLGAPRKARIEIIPLIDVIFFLLATFVLFTLSLEKIGAIDVMLPKGRDMIDESSADLTVYLQASENGTFYWKEGANGAAEPMTLAELPQRLAAYRARVGAPRVLIRGDSRAKFGLAVQALDEVRRAGIEQVSIETLVSKTGG